MQRRRRLNLTLSSSPARLFSQTQSCNILSCWTALLFGRVTVLVLQRVCTVLHFTVFGIRVCGEVYTPP